MGKGGRGAVGVRHLLEAMGPVSWWWGNGAVCVNPYILYITKSMGIVP